MRLGLSAMTPVFFLGFAALISCSDTQHDSVGSTAVALGSTIELLPLGDTYLKDGNPNQNQGDDTILRVRKTGTNRALVQFDQAALQAAVVPQNLIRRAIIAAVSAKATKRTELEPSPALPTAQHPRARHGICLCPAQCAHLMLMPDAAWDQDAR